MVHQAHVMAALQRPAAELGLLPEWAGLRPQLDIHVYPTLPSTNQEAWRLVDGGHGAGTVVIAREQSAGRGSRGHRWSSAPGGLYLSIVLEPDVAPAEISLLTLASAWGVVTSLERLGIPLQIKWPNDLIYQGRKVGGILTESRSSGAVDAIAAPSTTHPVVIGLGANWDNPLPDNALSLRQLLPESGIPSLKSVEDLAAIAVYGILQGYFSFCHQLRASFIQQYQNKLSHLGKWTTLRGNTAMVKGVTAQGELMIEVLHSDGEKTMQSLRPGEISLGYNV